MLKKFAKKNEPPPAGIEYSFTKAHNRVSGKLVTFQMTRRRALLLMLFSSHGYHNGRPIKGNIKHKTTTTNN